VSTFAVPGETVSVTGNDVSGGKAVRMSRQRAGATHGGVSTTHRSQATQVWPAPDRWLSGWVSARLVAFRASIGLLRASVRRVRGGAVAIAAAIGLSLAITGCSDTSPQTPTDSDDSGTAATNPVTPRPAPPSSTIPTGGPPPAGMIVFTKAGGSYADDTPFVSRLDGTHERQLTEAGVTCCIRLSPDKTSILGASLVNDGRITVGIYPLSGGPSRDLPLPAGTLSLGPGAWVPDGKQIVVQGWDDSHQAVSGMYLVDSSDGGHRVRLTHEPRGTNDIPGDVSPDGKSLIFVRERADLGQSTSEGDLFIMRLDGTGGIRRLVPSSFVVGLGSMRFSPDGVKILFEDGRTSPRGALWTIHPDGSHLTKIFDDPDLFASHPTWSPDGTQILFALNPVADFYTHPPNAFYVMDANGSGLRRVLDDGQFKREAEWFTPHS
jgi:dipeptidyl aminopeptidase/acylaminoacyl peptidase